MFQEFEQIQALSPFAPYETSHIKISNFDFVGFE
jgi:hypothetical protein